MVKNSIRKEDEKQLIEEAKKGSQKAFAELHRRYSNSIKYFALKKLVGSDPEDFVQEVFIKAFKNIGSYQHDFKFMTFLFKVAKNLMIDTYRKKKLDTVSMTSKSNDDEEFTHDTEETGKNPIEQFMNNDNIDLLLSAIEEHLSPTYREIIKAKYFEEKSLKEIADEFNIPIGTVKGAIFRAQGILKMNLNKNLFSV